MREKLFRLEHHQSIPSTQELMKQKIRAGENVDRLIIRADEQTRGQGRLGRKFVSPLGGSYQTTAFKDKDGKMQKPYAAILFALALTKELEIKDVPVKIKWPNDIYLNDKKLAGVLVDYLKNYLVVGIGVNVANEVPDYATALKIELQSVHQIVTSSCREAITYFEADFDLAREFKAYDYLTGQAKTVRVGQEKITGIVKGITAEGCLILRQDKGRKIICSGQII